MFYWFYPMNGLYTYNMGTAMGRLLMDMRAQIPQKSSDVYYAVIGGESKGPFSADWDFAANISEVKPLVSFTPPPVPKTVEGEDAEPQSDAGNNDVTETDLTE